MKIRFDFVTNSSSSSFIIEKSKLSEEQLDLIYNPSFKAHELNLCEWEEPESWTLLESDNLIVGYTSMDNFDWIRYLKLIGVEDFKETPNPGRGTWGLDLLEEIEFDYDYGKAPENFRYIKFLGETFGHCIDEIIKDLEDWEDWQK